MNSNYRGRIAPTPTGFMHLGHAQTFWTARQRCRERNGALVFRTEDLDRLRCKPEFHRAMHEDLAWIGLKWEEGPDVGGPHAPYVQSERMNLYREAFATLKAKGFLYPCNASRKDVLRALTAPHQGDEEPVYPGICRPGGPGALAWEDLPALARRSNVNWRFLVPEGRTVSFEDGCLGPQAFIAGKHFGDFIVWRHDDTPSYQLAVTADDAAMEMSEVVRGKDLLVSTARQVLLYEALNLSPPAFYHCPLVLDPEGNRLAKRHDSLSLRSLRQQGLSPEEIIQRFKERG